MTAKELYESIDQSMVTDELRKRLQNIKRMSNNFDDNEDLEEIKKVLKMLINKYPILVKEQKSKPIRNMNRYIEIIFDDSGSMASEHSSGKPRHIVAKELFVKSVLPSIGKPGDKVMLRLLRETGCEVLVEKESVSREIGPTQEEIEHEISSINRFNKNTPLYLTIKDCIEECSKLSKKNSSYTDYLIFVLTDGGDTCYTDVRSVISEKEMQQWNVVIPKLDPVLVQFDIDNSISKTNLEGAIRFLGGRSVNVSNASKKSITLVKNALKRSGFEGNILPHCIESQPYGKSYTWNELENENIFFHQAQLLNQSKLLCFEPNLDRQVTHDQYYDLKFLHSLAFVSHLPMNLIKSMVTQLEKPLLYTHECIRWDFAKARWFEIEKPEFFAFKEDAQAKNADKIFENKIREEENWKDFDVRKESYQSNTEYIVVQNNFGEFILEQHNKKKDYKKFNRSYLHEGKVVVFLDE